MKREYIKSESGSITVQMLFFSIVFFILGGLAIDVTNAYRMRTTMQATADAAAVAGARELPTEADAKSMAATYVELNMPASVHGTVANATDYVVGNWDVNAREFIAGATPYNALEVNLTRAESHGNSVATFLLKFAGMDTWDIRTRSIALYESSFSCVGIIAELNVEMGQDVRINDGVCVFGRDYISFGQDPYVSADAAIGTVSDPIDLRTGQDPRILGEKFSDPDIHATRAINISTTIDEWEAAHLNGDPGPFGGYDVQVVNSLPGRSAIASRTVYIVNGNVNIGQDYVVTDVVIAARGDVSFGQDGRLTNSQDCNTSNAIGLFSTRDISFGQDAHLVGVDLIAGRNINMGQDVRAFWGSMEANGYIHMAQDPHFTTCKPLQIGPEDPSRNILALVR